MFVDVVKIVNTCYVLRRREMFIYYGGLLNVWHGSAAIATCLKARAQCDIGLDVGSIRSIYPSISRDDRY